MAKPFAHHTPGPDARRDMATLREKFAALYAFIEALAGGPSRERSLALVKLEESAHWANKACVLADPESKPEE